MKMTPLADVTDELIQVQTVLTAAVNAASEAPKEAADLPMHLKRVEELRGKYPHSHPLREGIDAVYEGLRKGLLLDINGMGVHC